MNPSELPPVLYPVVLSIAAVGWAALIVFPYDRKVNLWFSGVAVPLTLCCFYMYLLITFWFLPPAGRFAGFLTLPRIHQMFENNGLLLVALINILAMGLVTGAWMARKGAQTGMSGLLIRLCLVVMAGSAGFGFVVFSIVAAISGRWNGIARVEEVPVAESQPAMATALRASQEAR